MAKKDDSKIDYKQFFATLGAVVLGGLIAFAGNVFVQAQQFNQESIRNDREVRKEIYLDFLDSSNSYSNATLDARSCLKSLGSIKPDEIKEIIKKNAKCDDKLNDLASARHDFQGYVNKISIYGSQDAWKASGSLQHALPLSIGDGIDENGIPKIGSILDYDSSKLSTAYTDFLSISCRELPSIPRSNCDE